MKKFLLPVITGILALLILSACGVDPLNSSSDSTSSDLSSSASSAAPV